MTDPRPDPYLLAATIGVLAETGWERITLEKVAERAGRSRSTVWRQGVTLESLLAALLDEMADDFRITLWPLLNSDLTGRGRLEGALTALCDLIDRHLPLVLASDDVFHQGEPGRRQINYLEPYQRFVRDGQADGSLPPAGDSHEIAELAFNGVAWTYAHLRGRHEWAARRARDRVVHLVMGGIAPA